MCSQMQAGPWGLDQAPWDGSGPHPQAWCFRGSPPGPHLPGQGYLRGNHWSGTLLSGARRIQQPQQVLASRSGGAGVCALPSAPVLLPSGVRWGTNHCYWFHASLLWPAGLLLFCQLLVTTDSTEDCVWCLFMTLIYLFITEDRSHHSSVQHPKGLLSSSEYSLFFFFGGAQDLSSWSEI